MNVRRHLAVIGLAAATVVALPVSRVQAGAQAPAVELGSINFPSSAKPPAQGPFLIGVKALYNFEFDIAGEAFRDAQKADPAFALGYWGEAMSFNHPLWAEQDLASARKALEKLAPTSAARAAKAPAGKERDLVEAADVLFGAGDKLARDIAYSQAMGRMHAKYPQDDEVAVMYTLSLLGTARPGEKTTRNAMQAASIALDVFQRHPQHPGAAHFIIHSFDDPDHAILSLPAARAYSKIAPSAAHALHMPSHIFVQLGMWDDVIASNIVAYKAAIDLADKKNLPRGREDFHTLSWLQYAYLQEGKFDDAQKCVDQAKAVADKNADNPRIRDGYAAMKARQVVESEQVGEARAVERTGQGRRRTRLRRQRRLRPCRRAERGQARRRGHRRPGADDVAVDAEAGGVGIERVSRQAVRGHDQRTLGRDPRRAQRTRRSRPRRQALQGRDRHGSNAWMRRRDRSSRSSRRSSCTANSCSRRDARRTHRRSSSSRWRGRRAGARPSKDCRRRSLTRPSPVGGVQ